MKGLTSTKWPNFNGLNSNTRDDGWGNFEVLLTASKGFLW